MYTTRCRSHTCVAILRLESNAKNRGYPPSRIASLPPYLVMGFGLCLVFHVSALFCGSSVQLMLTGPMTLHLWMSLHSGSLKCLTCCGVWPQNGHGNKVGLVMPRTPRESAPLRLRYIRTQYLLRCCILPVPALARVGRFGRLSFGWVPSHAVFASCVSISVGGVQKPSCPLHGVTGSGVGPRSANPTGPMNHGDCELVTQS